MRKSAGSHSSGGADNQSPNRSYVAMFLSALLPGLGQLYLGASGKAFLIFLVFTSALGIFYLNSMPVTDWNDLLRFKPAPPQENTDPTSETEEPYALHLWTFDNGEKLMFSPSWKLKISATIQALLCWLYAVVDGWKGRRRT